MQLLRRRCGLESARANRGALRRNWQAAHVHHARITARTGRSLMWDNLHLVNGAIAHGSSIKLAREPCCLLQTIKQHYLQTQLSYSSDHILNNLSLKSFTHTA
jgi:hypothetical protein